MAFDALLDSPLFGITLTIGAMVLFQLLFRKTHNPLLNPQIFAIIGIIVFLKLTGVTYQTYNQGGQVISFFLGPVTVALAVPLYRQFDKLKKNAAPILLGIFAGTVTAVLATVGLSLLFHLNREMIASLAPKATTTAIAMELSQVLGGIPSLTVAFVILAGLTGFIIGEQWLNVFHIKSRIARGIGLGTASHALGTTRALLMGEEEGAMSSLAIGVAGIMTSILLPVFMRWVLPL